MDNSKFFKCDCHSHGIEIVVSQEEVGSKDFFIMPWRYDFHSGKSPLWLRLKTVFRYLFKKEDLIANEVILDSDKALEMANWIKALS